MEDIRSLLKTSQFSYSKSLGQNFLHDEKWLNGICDCAEIDPSHPILEIGPGAGTLTRLLAQRAKQVLAVEIDRSLEPILATALQGMDNVTIHFADVMKMDLEAVTAEAFQGMPFSVVANLPYYITTPVLMRLLESSLPIRYITVMVQREVADRMAALPGTKAYGALSVAVQYRADTQIAMKVPAAAFYPKPSVDSAVVHMRMYAEKPAQPVDEKLFRRVVRAAFSMRRKTLANCLISGLALTREQTEALLAQADIPLMARGETLSIPQFVHLANQAVHFVKQ